MPNTNSTHQKFPMRSLQL